MGNVVCTVPTNQAKTETEQLCVNSSACHICLNIAMCSPFDFLCHTETHSLRHNGKSSVNFRKDKNKQPKCHHWPALYWLCGSFSAGCPLSVYSSAWLTGCLLHSTKWFNQSASLPEQTFGLIRQHLGVIWCQRRAGTKKQLGTCWSNAVSSRSYTVLNFTIWQPFLDFKHRTKNRDFFLSFIIVKHCGIWFILL